MRYHSFLIVTLTTFLLFASVTQCIYAQLPIYNSDFRVSRSILTKGDLGDSLRIMGIVDRTYDVQGVNVIEYYEMNSAQFLGFAGDTTKFDFGQLPYLNRTQMMRRLVKQFGAVQAHDIRLGKFMQGILQKDILEMHGWPEKKKRDGKKVTWIYDEVVLEFEEGILTQFTRQGS